MLDAVFGAVIVVVATTALVLAVEVVESSIGTAGRQSLTPDERTLLRRALRDDDKRVQEIENYLKDEGRPRTWK